ncbi:MAG: hypothetical protein LAO19_07450 [Acidobacteriia bacterium]|nr:hypothetical protein [Terriglobia bacterium]
MSDQPRETDKKVCQEPNLMVYADITNLTGAVIVAGAKADAMFGGTKTA